MQAFKYVLHAFLILFLDMTVIVNGRSAGKHRMNYNQITKSILQKVDTTKIRQFLMDLSAEPHLAGTENNLAEYVHDNWMQYQLSSVKYYSYNVLLSYPDWSKPNQVSIVNDTTNEVIFAVAGKQKLLHSPEESDPIIAPNFSAYSRPGIINGDLVYAHYGTASDIKWLQDQGIDLQGKILIARNGAIFRGDIGLLAEQHGASGLILYSDPKDYAPNGPVDVYPKSIWLPGSGAQYGTLSLSFGDPLTPNYPSVEGAHRISVQEAKLPKIPVQPIGYTDAEEILKAMGGVSSPPHWMGHLNAPYNVGPGFIDHNLKLKLVVRTSDHEAKITNVIGVIRGSVEPDRYVILGNHRDAWALGAMDPSSGTAVLLEVTRIFGELYKEGWRPRRTLIFASWDAEEYGYIGSQEWVEENLKIIKDRTVAYLNVDMAVQGRFTLSSKGLPTLQRLAYESAKKIPNPDPEEISHGRLTVYDTWLHHCPDTKSHIFNEVIPRMPVPGSGSDFAPFLHVAGVAVMDIRYTSNNTNPLYHTLYETFYEMEVLVDPGFKFHAAMTQLWAEIAHSLADSEILPLNVEDYGHFLKSALQEIKAKYGLLLMEHNISLKYFEAAIEKFASTSKSFQKHLQSLDINNSIAVRAANDKLMQVERAFLQPEGLPNRNHLKHVVFAPSSLNEYGSSIFSSFTDILTSANSPEDWENVAKELSAVVYYIQSAKSILSEF